MFGKIISTSADQNKYKLAIFGLYNTGQQWHNFHFCSPELYTSRYVVYLIHNLCCKTYFILYCCLLKGMWESAVVQLPKSSLFLRYVIAIFFGGWCVPTFFSTRTIYLRNIMFFLSCCSHIYLDINSSIQLFNVWCVLRYGP